MNHTHQNAAVRTEPRTINAPPTQALTHTTQSLAAEFNIKPSTVGSWVSRWLTQVAPESLLKQGKGVYTELAHTLMQEFAGTNEKDRSAWVAGAKRQYAAEWGSAGVIDCEIMPDNVGGVLALLQTNNSSLEQSIELELSQVGDFIDQLNTTDADFSAAEMQQFVATGTKKAIAQFKAEEIARVQALNALRQRRMGGGEQA